MKKIEKKQYKKIMFIISNQSKGENLQHNQITSLYLSIEYRQFSDQIDLTVKVKMTRSQK